MTINRMSTVLLALVFAATTSVAQARSHRAHAAAWQAGTSYQNYDPPWTFACVKDHGTSRCNDLN
jgi:ABC-type sugar transport system substrate-binding protein